MKNRYYIKDEVVAIILTNKKSEMYETLIDADDLPRIAKYDYSWHLRYAPNTRSHYAKTTLNIVDDNGKKRQKTLYLHSLIMNVTSSEIIDHINHDTLDNRKVNLRVVENNKNLKHRKSKNTNNKSGYRNVCWLKNEGAWCVQLQIDGKNTRLGYFDDVHEAGKFAEDMREKYYRKFKGES